MEGKPTNSAQKKKWELLGSCNKRKMSLRKYMDNLKQNECRLEISQITNPMLLNDFEKRLWSGAERMREENDATLKGNGKRKGKRFLKMKDDSPVKIEDHSVKIEAVENQEDEIIDLSNSPTTVEEITRAPTETIINIGDEIVEIVHVAHRSPVVSEKSVSSCDDDVTIIDNNTPIIVEKLGSFQENAATVTDDTRPTISETSSTYFKTDIMELPLQIRAPEGLEILRIDSNAPKPPQPPVESSIYSTTITVEPAPRPSEPTSYPATLTVTRPQAPSSVDSPPFSTTITLEPLQNSKTVDDTGYSNELSYREERGNGGGESLSSFSDEEMENEIVFDMVKIKMENHVFDMPLGYEEEGSPQKLSESEDKVRKYTRRPPQCKICSQNFSSYAKLKKHKMEHDGDKPYLCLQCGMNHESLEHLIAHLRTHKGDLPYRCKKCHRGFKTIKALEGHQPVHVLKKVVEPKKLFQCEVCSKGFRKLCDLERHTRVHTGEKPSVCNICNQRFQQAHNLNKHLLIHTQEKPFQCDICNKKFGRNDVLNRHLLTHSVSKPNHCGYCMKSFIRMTQLLAHVEKYHPNTSEVAL